MAPKDMNHPCFCLVVAVLLAGAGCKKAAPSTPPAAGGTPSSGGLPSLNTPAATPAPGAPALSAPAAPPPPPPGTAAAIAPAAPVTGKANGVVQLMDQEGNAMTAEKVMNRALEYYVEGLGKPVPEDFNELVKANILKTIPPPPAGQKWVFDPKQGKIVASAP